MWIVNVIGAATYERRFTTVGEALSLIWGYKNVPGYTCKLKFVAI